MAIPTTTDRAVVDALIDIVRKDAKRKSRKKQLAHLIEVLLTDTLLALMTGWFLMLAIGVIHHEWIRQCPTLGYGWAVVLSALLRPALNQPPRKNKSDGAR